MVIFFVVLVYFARARFCFLIAWLWRAMFVRRLVVATRVAFVMVMRIMAALPVVVVAIAVAWLAIFWIVAALLIGVLGLVAMDVVRLTRKLRQRVLLWLIVLVAAVVRRFVAAIAIVIVTIIATA
jgi:hypothetical protein